MGLSDHYHRRTEYDPRTMIGRRLDWSRQPGQFKTYPDLQSVELPGPGPTPGRDDQSERAGRAARFDLNLLSGLLFHGGGVTLVRRGQPYRAAASAGALYPIEIYPAVAGLPGLADGLYHYSPFDHSLTLIRPGRPTAWAGADGPRAGLFLSAMFYRSAWKYGDRAFRYCLLDAGHVAENLILAGRAWGLRPQLAVDFRDREVNRLLGLNRNKETALALIDFIPNRSADRADGEPNDWPDAWAEDWPGQTETSPFAEAFPPTPALTEALAETESTGPSGRPLDSAELGLHPGRPEFNLPDQPLGPIDLARMIPGRRSKRNFVPAELAPDKAVALAGVLNDHHPALVCGCLVQDVAGWTDGFYTLENGRLGLARPGRLQPALAAACLDQAWTANAGFQAAMLTNLDLAQRIGGPRSYRALMISAGRLGQRIYLAAEALGLGACGVGAFFDRPASDLLGLSEESSLVYLTCCGAPKR